MDLSIIIVSHKSKKYLSSCLSSIKDNLGDVSYEIIIVDNDMAISPADFSLSNISIIRNHSNSSYGEANNLGAKKAKAPILWFLNPDTKILTSNTKALLRLLKDDSVGIIGTKLVEESGKAQKRKPGFATTPM